MSMDTEHFARLEQLLDRELSAEEKERLRRIKDTLQISDNDALWDIIAAMEYQRKYYDELPEKIAEAATEIFDGLALAAEKEAALAQSRLADSVVEQAKKMSLNTHVHTWLIWGSLSLVLLLLYGSFLMWAGYCLGAGQTHPPSLMMRMPAGIILGGIGLFGGVFWGANSARSFSEGDSSWKKNLGIALCVVLASALVLVFAM